jgi:hypothetical protein
MALVTYHISQRPAPLIPAETEVDHVDFEVFAVEGQTEPIPRTRVPTRYIPDVLHFFQPVTLSDYPADWDELFTIGKVTIETRTGQSFEIKFVSPGKCPLCFLLNGVRCMRGGDYNPIIDVVVEGQKYGYANEALLLLNALREINWEHCTGKESEKLQKYLDDQARSAGRLPPRRGKGGVSE